MYNLLMLAQLDGFVESISSPIAQKDRPKDVFLVLACHAN